MKNNKRLISNTTMKGSLSRQLMTIQQDQNAVLPLHNQASSSSRFHIHGDSDVEHQLPSNSADVADDFDFILSQDIFCTPDYITPEAPANPSCFGFTANEHIACPESPQKVKSDSCKRQRLDDTAVTSIVAYDLAQHQMVDYLMEGIEADYVKTNQIYQSQRTNGYVSQSAVALRCRVMPPPCIRNPYLKDSSLVDMDPFDNHRTKCAGLYPAANNGDGLSRYRSDFHEIEKIGDGNFSRVFKVLKRIDGCLYAVKHSIKQLRNDRERKKALMEVQALAALGVHENIVGYHSSWFEDEQLYIQMELCDRSLSITKYPNLLTDTEVLLALHQIAKALFFIHEKGIAHLDVKPDNIYIKNAVYKLGDFGCATLCDRSLPIEEGDARYMPQEILNEKYDYLEKVDIFSLGVSIFELARGSPLSTTFGYPFFNVREGESPLLPGRSLQLQNLLKVFNTLYSHYSESTGRTTAGVGSTFQRLNVAYGV